MVAVTAVAAVMGVAVGAAMTWPSLEAVFQVGEEAWVWAADCQAGYRWGCGWLVLLTLR